MHKEHGTEEANMPYGVDKEIGGDSKENDAWMENCVQKVMSRKGKDGKPIDKSSAVAICKTTLSKSKGDHAKAQITLESLDNPYDIVQK
jgi:hypothetical protein